MKHNPKPELSERALTALRESRNLLREPIPVQNEIFSLAEYMRHTNQPFAYDALRASESESIQ